MKLETIGDRYVLYHVSNLHEFGLMEDDLRSTVQLTDNHKVMGNLDLSDYIEQMRTSIRNKNRKFFLIVAYDKEIRRIVAMMPCFIVIDNADQNKCLIYGAFFFPMLLHILLGRMLYYIDAWSKEFNSISTFFDTTRNADAYSRMLKRYGFKLSSYIFERKIDYGY